MSFTDDKTGILSTGVEKAAAFIEAIGLSRQDGRQIEAETIHPHLGCPISQAIGHHLEDS
jgi:hypothetical protein